MCENHKHNHQRHGAALEHGEAHEQDHKNWSRRTFLKGLGVVGGSSILLKVKQQSFRQNPCFDTIARWK